jgi:RHS repeat-associated protein
LALIRENNPIPFDTLFYHQDHIGSTGVITDSWGNKVEDIFYKPFGETVSDTGTQSVSHKFTGQEMDDDTGLYNYNARLYDPVVGKFVSADTVVQQPETPQALNRYAYCLNNPVKYIDPEGHSFILGIVVGAIIGAISAGIQSHWNLKATLTGAVIGAVSGAAFSGASAWAEGLKLGYQLAPTTIGGAASGATAGALCTVIYGGNALENISKGALYGGIGGAAFGAIGGHYGEAWGMSRVGISALAGGGISELAGGNFAEGFILAGASSALYWGYKAMAGFAPNYGPGEDIPGGRYEPNNLKQAPTGKNVSGLNQELTGDFWEDFWTQGSFVSQRINAFPGGNATAGLHDFWMNNISMNLVTNVATMLPAAVVSYGAALGGPMAPMSSAFMISYKGYRND